MVRKTVYVLTIALLAACSRTLIISDPTEKVNEPHRGSVDPLVSYLPNDGNAVKLILVHGVGDHCPGNGLGKDGWLSDETIQAIGLHADSPPSKEERIYSDEFLNMKRDEKSYLTIVKRQFEYRPTVNGLTVSVEAIEITWSPLTQWIKNKQLGYDFTGNIKDPKDTSLDCVEEPPKEYASPPPRQYGNQLIKEQIFNRNLADAVLYMGAYGKNMQLGFADALCHAITNQPSGVACDWPKPSPTDNTKYIFVTHSLGSRIVYDTLLDLNDKPFISQMMANTPVIYMMANQLPLLGLANTDPLDRSDQPPKPTFFNVTNATGPGSSLPELTTPNSKSNNLLCAFAETRMQGFSNNPHERLDIVAFSDSDDLLSWGIPPWYLQPDNDGACNSLNIRITNVYVQNAIHWLGLVESPAVAHSGYFVNFKVWDVIRCGANSGKLNCP